MTDITPLQALRAIGLTDAEIRDGAEGHTVAPTIHAACIRAAAELGPERVPVTRDTPLGAEIAHDGGRRRWLVGWQRKGWMVVEDERGLLAVWDPDGWRVVEEVDQ